MDLPWWILMTTLMLKAKFSFSSQCPVSGSSNLHLTIGSRRNTSGHWLLTVDAFRENSKSSQQLVGDEKGLSVDMEHRATYCHGTESQYLMMSAAVPGAVPPAGYEPITGLGYYKTHLAPLTWEQAKDKCEQEGGHLIILDSERETIVIKEFFARKHQITGATHAVYVHVGVHDRYKEGQYEDVLGAPVNVAGNPLWHSGQPDGGAENCVVGTTIGKYADAPCSWKLAYICEYM